MSHVNKKKMHITYVLSQVNFKKKKKEPKSVLSTLIHITYVNGKKKCAADTRSHVAGEFENIFF